jgi:hypothetical protein
MGGNSSSFSGSHTSYGSSFCFSCGSGGNRTGTGFSGGDSGTGFGGGGTGSGFHFCHSSHSSSTFLTLSH